MIDTNRYIVFFIVVLLACVVVYSIYFGKSYAQKPVGSLTELSEEKSNTQPVCSDGEIKTCKSGDCDGTSICKNGYWTDCHVTKKCAPGTTVSCIENGCAVGYKVCNECGTDYEGCIKNNTNK